MSNPNYLSTMNWRERIVSDPDTLFGKPRIKGTRIGVNFLLDCLREGASLEDVLTEYPHLKREDLEAAIAYGMHARSA